MALYLYTLTGPQLPGVMPLYTVQTLLLGDITRGNGLANFLLPRASHLYKI